METRFIEAQDEGRTNWGKFLLVRFTGCDLAYPSAVSGTPLLDTMPLVRRLGTPLREGTLWLLDLQTQEGCAFDPAEPMDAIETRFLEHPLKVCILFYPLMRWLAEHASPARAAPPALVTLSRRELMRQPGVLLDLLGQRVERPSDWGTRGPIVSRLRNPEQPPDAA